MTGIADLAHSERGTWCLIVFVTITLAFFLGKVSSTEWLAAVGSLTTILVASKTVTTVNESRVLKEPQIVRGD